MILKGDTGRLEINILKRSNSQSTDYWDGNWLEAVIGVEISGSKVLYNTNLRVDDLQGFNKKIIDMRNGNIKECEFTTMEEGLWLHFRTEFNGSVNCKGKTNSYNGNSLNFALQTDFLSLDFFINELGIILKLYPLVGCLIDVATVNGQLSPI
jgi:hypothetical protein